MQRILDHLIQTYRPLAVICYGSFAHGDNDADSDFDVLLVTDGGQRVHDASRVCGVQMDAFVYPFSEITAMESAEEYAQIFDGKVVLDTDGIGQALKAKAAAYWDALPQKTQQEALDELKWCRKMAVRARRGDAEGNFRLHWLLNDSLEIACDVLGRRYFGPKKSLKWLEETHPALFSLYADALRTGEAAALDAWIDGLTAAYNVRFGA